MATTSGTNNGSVVVTTTTKTTDVVNSTTNITTTVTANTTTLSETAYSYMRAKTVDFYVSGLKPNTQYYPFFNKVYVGSFCSTVDGQVSSILKTNELGDIKGKFYIPASTFLCGSYTFSLVDNIRSSGDTFVADPIYGQAEAQYEANGVLKTQQTQVTLNSVANTNTTITSTNTAVTNVVAPVVNNSVAAPIVTTPISAPPPTRCVSYYFEYAVVSSPDVKLFTVTTNSVTPPSSSSVEVATGAQQNGVGGPLSGVPGGAAVVRYISTSANLNQPNTWNHTFAGHRSRSGKSGTVKKYRQECIVTEVGGVGSLPYTVNSIPFFNFRPSGLKSTDTVSILTQWTRIGFVACPVGGGVKSGDPVLVSSTDIAPYDPIAQSFFITADTYPAGVYVTSVGVYFRTVDQSTPVILELRNMVNGLPGSQVFPGARALLPGSAIAQSPDATTETVFKFDNPVFLQTSQDYCFVVRTSSLGYNLWCSKIGERDVTTGKIVDTNPYSGSMFLSENNYTWTPDQTQDVKFNLYVAEFDTSKVGDVIVRPQADAGNNVYYGTSQSLPMSFINTTKGSKTVSVTIPMHGLVTGDSIVIEGIGDANPEDATIGYNNILASNLNGSHTVTVVDEDTVTFATTGANSATKTGPVSASDMRLPINTAPPVTRIDQTHINALPVINSNNLSPSTIPSASVLKYPTAPQIANTNTFIVYTNVQVNELMIDYLSTELNQTSIDEYVSISTGSSTAGVETPYSYRPYEMLSGDKGFHVFDEPRLIATPSNETAHSYELLTNKSATVNIKLASSNKNVSPVIDVTGMSLMTKTYVIDNQNGELDELITESDFNDPTLNSEINPGTGNALAKYKTVVRSVTGFHNKITVFVTANCPAPAVIDAYIRTSGDRETHQDRDWVWTPIGGVFGRSFTHSVDKFTVNEWMYEISTDEPFNVYDIKLVMRSTNNSIIPKIYGVRTITQFA